tara:strand:- start:425 stop:838 length:414 start_codon:yes stop_codon:yes gene_type:complete
MAFKLGDERREFKNSENTRKFVEGNYFPSMEADIDETPILRTNLEGETIAEANMDGSISIDADIPVDSELFDRAIKHEQEHLDQIESGRAAYNDNVVMWEGKLYLRNRGFIDGPAGNLPEGHPDHPWEQEAIDAEDA